ncbi:choice-of-anchor W domain-containing protein [Thiohalorhabdus denitrificans]|uniref:PEP-CTERM protein-sorting domain-containing protein n=1 Tax=Thiohalorhabdus denitrificans TaxID=381306 RepID=A0A1G5HRD3_9GAMM|nr:choice-of-anchor W domain-containing protein [Thiohalorhabdus denitrificans]SCY66009.1 PEP-CTERM protein-sorting domain-containing protein [Thiohalorhabdus denitrificans]
MQKTVHAMLGITGLAAGLAVSGTAGAVATETYNADTDPSATDFEVDGYSALPFVAEGRIGGPGTHELDVGSNTAGDYDSADHEWGNGPFETFDLNWDGEDAQWKVGDDSTTYSDFDSLNDFNSLLIRTATPGAGTEVAFEDVTLNGSPVPGLSFSNTYDTDAADSDRLVKWMGMYDAGDLAQGFNLSGSVAMSWPEGEKPSQSNLAFQVKGANHANEVPAPATGALLLGGLLGLWKTGRRLKA